MQILLVTLNLGSISLNPSPTVVIYEASANIEYCTFDWTISPQITDLRQSASNLIASSWLNPLGVGQNSRQQGGFTGGRVAKAALAISN